jgi:hypothetical protein
VSTEPPKGGWCIGQAHRIDTQGWQSGLMRLVYTQEREVQFLHPVPPKPLRMAKQLGGDVGR